MSLPVTSAGDPAEIYELIEKLGEGSYGEVYQAIDRRTGRAVAIKVIPVESDLTDFQKEIEILQRCKSPYVVSYLGSYLREGDLWIVMEYCGAGSVADLMAICDITLTEEEIAEVTACILRGLQYLHENKLIHRDLKAGNVLLTEDGAAKLADFGVSAQLSSTMSKRRTVIGTPFWMSPEVIQESAYDARADIWSLGITAIEMADGEPPHAAIHPMRAIFLIPSREPPTVKEPAAWSPAFIDFLAQCLKKDFTKRPSAGELLRHPFVAAAAARINANGGTSPLLAELVAQCLPTIYQARQADSGGMETSGEEGPAPGAGGGVVARDGSGRTVQGTMVVAPSGDTLHAGSASGTTVITGTTVFNAGVAGGASGTMVVGPAYSTRTLGRDGTLRGAPGAGGAQAAGAGGVPAGARKSLAGGGTLRSGTLVTGTMRRPGQAGVGRGTLRAGALAGAGGVPSSPPPGSSGSGEGSPGGPGGGLTMVGTLRENASDVMGVGFSSAPSSPEQQHGTMVVTPPPGAVNGAGKGGGGGRRDSGSEDKGADGKGTLPFMSYFNRQAAAAAAATAAAAPPAAPAPAPAPVAPPAPPPLAKELYEQLTEPSFLAGLSKEELEDKLYELDAQFRRDMASLTERYDAARSALEAEMEKH